MMSPAAPQEGRNLNGLYRTLSTHMNMTEAQVGQEANQSLQTLINRINPGDAPLWQALQSQHNIRTQEDLRNGLLHLSNEAQRSFFSRWIAEPAQTWIVNPLKKVGGLLNSRVVQTALLGLGMFFGFKWLWEKLKEAKKASEDKSIAGLFGSLFFSGANSSMRKRDGFKGGGYGQEKGPNELPKLPLPPSGKDEPKPGLKNFDDVFKPK